MEYVDKSEILYLEISWGDGDVWALKLARGFSMDKSTNQWLAEKRHK